MTNLKKETPDNDQMIAMWRADIAKRLAVVQRVAAENKRAQQEREAANPALAQPRRVSMVHDRAGNYYPLGERKPKD